MARFGSLYAQFYDPGDLTTPLQDATEVNYRIPISAATNDAISAPGETTVVFAADPLLVTLAYRGNYCILYQNDEVRPAVLGPTPFGDPFIIRKITAGPEENQVTISGPSLLADLSRFEVDMPVGGAVITNTSVAEAVGDPVATTLSTGAPTNNDHVVLTSVTGMKVGDELRVTMEDDRTHITRIMAINPPSSPAGTVVMRDRLIYTAEAGRAAVARHRKIEVAAGAGAAFMTGVEVRVTLDNNTQHITLVDEDPDGDEIALRDGLPDSAAVGKAVQGIDHSAKTTSDVSYIIEDFTDSVWEVEFETGTGTAWGTRYPGGGESVLNVLTTIVNETGEFFRLKRPGAAIYRTVQWRRTSDTAGHSGSLRLVMPSQASIDTEAANYNRAIIIGKPQIVTEYDPVTRVYPVASDPRVTLFSCSAAAVSAAAAVGFSVVTTPAALGLYGRPYVMNGGLDEDIGNHERTVTFSEVGVESDNVTAIQSAADKLLGLAMTYLTEHAGERTYYEVDVVSALDIRVGQRVEMVYEAPDAAHAGVNATGTDALYVQEAGKRVEWRGVDDPLSGVPITTLLLSTVSAARPSATRETARRLLAVDRLAGGAAGATVVVNQGGGTAGDHGESTGLDDDDHTQYLRTDGTRALAGNLAVGSGLTVDGVDISAHAANPSAHHAPVTVLDGSITLSGQGIRVADAFAGDGLGLTAGVLAAKVSTALGTKIVTDVLGVDAWASGGLYNGANGLQLRLPANSGLVVDANGLYLAPSTLTASTTNAVSGAGHTHAVTAADDARGITSLLKSNVGLLALTRLGVGRATDTAAGLAVSSPATDDYAVWIKQIAGQTAELWRVEDTSGAALIRLTGGGNLESGNPAFVSGQTGWQMAAAGRAEFQDVFVRGELHASTFVADEIHATGGTLQVATAAIVAAPVGGSDNKLPALNSIFTLNLQASWDLGASYVAVGDVLRWKSMAAAGGGLDLYDVYLQVTAVGSLAGRDLANGNPGYFPVTCNRRNGGATNVVIPTRSAVVKWAKVAQTAGTYTGGLLLTADLNYAPYIDIFTVANDRTGAQWSTPPAPIPRVRLGNLRGVLGKSADEWGIAAGADLSDATTLSRYLVASDLGVTLRNIDLDLYKNAERTIRLDRDNGLQLLAGEAYESIDNARTIDWIDSLGVVRAFVSAWVDDEDGYPGSLELWTRHYNEDFGAWENAAMISMGRDDDPTTNRGNYIEMDASHVRINGATQASLSGADVHLAGRVRARNSGLHVGDGVTAAWADGALRAASNIHGGGFLIVGDANTTAAKDAGDVVAGGGLALGDVTLNPLSATLLLKERAATGNPPADTAHLWLQDVAGVQKLYIKFANGVQRELASA